MSYFQSLRRKRRSAFSLLELMIVLVIIGVIAAIAAPRLSRGAAGAGANAMKGDLKVLRNAIQFYATEHDGTFPAVGTFAAQLTTYTDASGGTAAAKDATHIYGPYIDIIPPLPVSGVGGTAGQRGDTNVAAAAAAGVAWIYDATAGTITANTGTAADDGGTLFTAY